MPLRVRLNDLLGRTFATLPTAQKGRAAAAQTTRRFERGGRSVRTGDSDAFRAERGSTNWLTRFSRRPDQTCPVSSENSERGGSARAMPRTPTSNRASAPNHAEPGPEGSEAHCYDDDRHELDAAFAIAASTSTSGMRAA